MAWIKVPPEHHPIFRAALPKDPRLETQPMFGGLAAKVNGNLFAGLFARSVMLSVPEPLRTEALALEGASYFDPMGDGRARSDKVMLPEALMEEPAELRAWLRRAFEVAVGLPRKGSGSKSKTETASKSQSKTETGSKSTSGSATTRAKATTKATAKAHARTKATATKPSTR